MPFSSIVRYQALWLRAFNDRTFGVIRDMMGLEENAKCMIPCKSSMSKWRCTLVNGLKLLMRVTEKHINCNGDYFEFFDIEFLLAIICRQFKAHEYGNDELALTLCLTLDGAPTTTRVGFVVLCLRLADSRWHPDLLENPQKIEFCFPVAGLWGTENKDNLERAFSKIIKQFRELGRTLFKYTLENGDEVHAKLKVIVTPDKVPNGRATRTMEGLSGGALPGPCQKLLLTL